MKPSALAVNVLLAALIVYTCALRYRAPETPPAPDFGLIPVTAGGFAGSDESQDSTSLDVLGADESIFRTYRRGGETPVWLFIGYFGSQQENSQIHSPKHCYPGGGWNIIEEGRTAMRIAGAEKTVKHLIISDGVETQFVLYWYTSAGEIITNEYALKWNQMKKSLRGASQATSFVRFSILLPGGEDNAGARRTLVDLAEALAPRIEGVLDGSGEGPMSRERTQ